MAAEEDVPLRDAARHYEEKFGDKVRQVRKPGAPPPANPPPDGGSGGGRGAGIGAVILGVFVVRALISFGSSSSRQPTPDPTFTPPPRVDFEQQRKVFEDLQRLQQDLEQRQFGWQPVVPGGIDRPAASYRFEEGDLPLPEGLCYRIEREARAAAPLSPGKRVRACLDPAAWDLVQRAARGEDLPRVDLDELRAALNELLTRQDFYSPLDFRGLPLPPEVSATWERLGRGLVPVPVEDVRKMNRLALEAAYPHQIVPADLRARRGGDRAEWVAGARRDLEEARKQDAHP
jgi:hypothetical protein